MKTTKFSRKNLPDPETELLKLRSYEPMGTSLPGILLSVQYVNLGVTTASETVTLIISTV